MRQFTDLTHRRMYRLEQYTGRAVQALQGVHYRVYLDGEPPPQCITDFDQARDTALLRAAREDQERRERFRAWQAGA